MPNKLKILRVRDKNENYGVKKSILPNVSFRMLLIARSGQGKTNFLTNLILRNEPEFYKYDFDADDIYIVSPSIYNDDKLKLLIESKEIPSNNVFDVCDAEVLNSLYGMIKEEYEAQIADGEKPKNSLIIIDDCMAELKMFGVKDNIINKMHVNGRHVGLSIILTSQYYTAIPAPARNNANCVVVFPTSDKEMEKIAFEHSPIEISLFKKYLKPHMKKNYDFVLIDYTKDPEERFKNSDFEIIEMQ